MGKIAQFFLVAAVRLYRWTLSPAKTFVLGPMAKCRFEPSCSEYALQALQVHGPWRGTWLATKRLCRCHPWGSFGPDPVPPVRPPDRPRSRFFEGSISRTRTTTRTRTRTIRGVQGMNAISIPAIPKSQVH